jgi:hypothetical protein
VLSVYSGRRCIGFLLDRGKSGIEAFNMNTKSIGVFPDQKSAADAVSAAALERALDDDEIAAASSSNLPYVLWRQARRENSVCFP